MAGISVLGSNVLGNIVLGSGDAGLSPLEPSIVNQLNLGQTVSIGREVNIRIFSALTLGQIVVARQAIINVTVTNALTLNQFAGRSVEATAENALTLDHFVYRTHTETVQSDLILDQSAVGVLESPNVSTLNLGQFATASLERVREITQEIDLGQFAFAIVIRPGITCLYAPILSDGSPMSPTLPTLTRQNYITLTYPYVSPTFTVHLRSPKLGDERRLATTWVRERSRSGELIGFADPSWPKTETVSLQFEALSEDQATDLLAMAHESLGEEIGYLDYDGRQWRGIITTPTAEILQLGRGCRYAGSIEILCF